MFGVLVIKIKTETQTKSYYHEERCHEKLWVASRDKAFQVTDGFFSLFLVSTVSSVTISSLHPEQIPYSMLPLMIPSLEDDPDSYTRKKSLIPRILTTLAACSCPQGHVTLQVSPVSCGSLLHHLHARSNFQPSLLFWPLNLDSVSIQNQNHLYHSPDHESL